MSFPRTGRIAAADCYKPGNALAKILHEAFRPTALKLLDGIVDDVRAEYAAMYPESDMEVLRKYWLQDLAKEVVFSVWDQKTDLWNNEIKIPLDPPIDHPQGRWISFYSGGTGPKNDGRTKTVIFDKYHEPALLILKEYAVIQKRVQHCKDFCTGYSDGNKQIRPLWSDIYEQFPELTSLRVGEHTAAA